MNPSLIVVISLLSSVYGHAVMTNIIVNGVVQTNCVRPFPSSKYDYPISDKTNPNGLQSTNMICGLPGKTANSASKCSVPAGSTIGFQWHYTDDLSDKAALAADTYYIDPSHKGPCLAYMARSDNGTGPVWFKIYENGYDTSTKQFCVDKLRANKGIFEAKIPADLLPGNYLIRAELIALHEGFQIGGAQPYIHCAELTITGSGTSNPSTNLVQFPGAYTATDPGIYFNIYNGIKSYPIPGPTVYVAGAVASSTSTSSSSTTAAPVSTGMAASTSTSGRVAATTGRIAATTGKIAGTTGKVATTGAAPAPPQTSTGTSGASGSCSNDGYMICSSSSTYQICNRGVWAAPLSCQSGLSCHPSGNYIYCV